MNYDFHANAIVKDAGQRGRGVYARRRLEPGEVVEVAPVIPVPGDESLSSRELKFMWNMYVWTESDDGSKWTLALPGGLALFFNHSYEPNMTFKCDHEQTAIVFRALRSVAEGEELVINYNGDGPGRSDPVWFDVA